LLLSRRFFRRQKEVLNILFLLCVLMLFYAWFGVVMFVDTKEGIELFPTLIEALWTLWICVTTANYPDVMMLGYNQNRFVALYFVSFMILSFFFLMNVILATVCNEYDTTMAQHQSDREKMSTNNLRQAYQLLLEQERNMIYRNNNDDTDHESNVFAIPVEQQQQKHHERVTIDRTTVMELFTILNTDFPEFRRQLTTDETQILFAILDRDGTSKITLDEFMDFGNVFLLELSHDSLLVPLYFLFLSIYE
jgi:lipopolysaccharide export LptBFGC system permease protein LptF